MNNKKICLILVLIVYLITIFGNFNISKANIFDGETLLLKGDHECPSLVQFWLQSGGFWSFKIVYYVYYNDKDTLEKYPAFCVEPAKEGVGTGYSSYDTLVTKSYDNVLWRILSNGYMGKTYKDWNLECDDDLYSATKIAIHSYKENVSPKEKYRVGQKGIDGLTLEEVQRRGTKVLDVAEELYNYGLNGNLVYEEPKVNVKEDKKEEKVIISGKEYFVQSYVVNTNKKLESYDVKLEGIIEGAIILDKNNNEKKSFSDNSFKIAIPIENIKEDINGKINIENVKIKTCPIYYCQSMISGAQSYITYTSGYEYTKTSLDFNLKANTASIEIMKIDDETKKPIENVTFKIFDSNDEELGSFKTDKDGIIELKNLNPSIIYLKEVSAPNEYKVNNEKIKVDLKWNETSKIEISNKLKKGSLKIKKVDSIDNLKTLEGVKFDLLDEKNNVIKHLVTDEKGQIEVKNLDKGIYLLRETKTIDGYNLDNTIYEIEIKPGKVFDITLENEKIPKLEPESEIELPKLPRTGF